MRKRRLFTDMAVEFCKSNVGRDDGLIKYYEVEVDQKMSNRIDRPCGRYTTLETNVVVSGRSDEYGRISDALAKSIKGYLKGCDKILCAGLGNPDLTADALGDRVFKKLAVNRHIDSERYLCALTANVLGMKGIECCDII